LEQIKGWQHKQFNGEKEEEQQYGYSRRAVGIARKSATADHAGISVIGTKTKRLRRMDGTKTTE